MTDKVNIFNSDIKTNIVSKKIIIFTLEIFRADTSLKLITYKRLIQI